MGKLVTAVSATPAGAKAGADNGTLNVIDSWEIERRYSDFEELFKVLKAHANPVLQSHRISLPPKLNISGTWTSQFMEKRKDKLQKFMNNILTHIGMCEEVSASLVLLCLGI